MRSGFFNWLSLNKNQASISYISNNSYVTIDQDGELVSSVNIDEPNNVSFLNVDRFGNLQFVEVKFNNPDPDVHLIYLYDKDGILQNTVRANSLVSDMVKDNQGNFYFIEDNASVYKMSATGTVVKLIDLESPNSVPISLAFTNSALFACYNHRIFKISLSGVLENVFDYQGTTWQYRGSKKIFTHNNQLFMIASTGSKIYITKVAQDSTLYDEIIINTSTYFKEAFSFNNTLYITSEGFTSNYNAYVIDTVNNTATLFDNIDVLIYVDPIGNSFSVESGEIVKKDSQGVELWRGSELSLPGVTFNNATYW